MRIVFVDNFDSFTFNLVDEFARRGCEVEVWRNTAGAAHILDRAESASSSLIVISPGPGRPADAGCCPELVRLAAGRVPVFGVCLGHQAIGLACGGRIVRARSIMHGKVSSIEHDGRGVFRDLPSPIQATRYHSLVIGEEGFPGSLEVTARTSDGEIMGVRHREHPIEGVQFHPESILTEVGKALLRRFLDRCAVGAAA